MDNFSHEVLGDVSDETRWLKIFTTADLIRLTVTIMICIFMLNTLPKTGFFIFLEFAILIGMSVRVALGIITRPKEKYLNGGGVSYLDILKRKRMFKKKKNESVYVMGVDKEYEYR